MEDSILDSIKKLLGIQKDYTDFDQDIIMGINAVFPTLAQIGLGPDSGFMILDNTTTWSDYLFDDMMLNNVKMYIYIKTKIIFDPPASSIVLGALNDAAKEYEWRIQLQVDKFDETKSDIPTIVQGSNDPLLVEIQISASDIANASAVLVQHNKVVKRWEYSEILLGTNEIVLPMTDAETMSLSNGYVTLETKWKTIEGNIDVGNTVKYLVVSRHDTVRV